MHFFLHLIIAVTYEESTVLCFSSFNRNNTLGGECVHLFLHGHYGTLGLCGALFIFIFMLLN